MSQTLERKLTCSFFVLFCFCGLSGHVGTSLSFVFILSVSISADKGMEAKGGGFFVFSPTALYLEAVDI